MISKEYPKGHPQVVQPAIQQAHNLIQNLDRKERGLEMQPFVYHNKGSMATIGRNHAVVELKRNAPQIITVAAKFKLLFFIITFFCFTEFIDLTLCSFSSGKYKCFL